MILELLPEVGVATVGLGMSAAEAVGGAQSQTKLSLGFTLGALTDSVAPADRRVRLAGLST